MRRLLVVALAMASCSGPKLRPPAPGDALALAGRIEGGPFGLSPEQLAKLPRRTVRGVEPRSGREASFSGADLAPFLAERLPLRPGADVVIFHGRGGYRAAVPLNAVRQTRPVLASEADGAPLDRWLPGTGPLLLAWPDAEAPGLDTDPRQRWFWVRGVMLIEVAVWQEALGRALRVPAGAGDDARHGSDTFGSQCIYCHRLRNRGGEVGPDLTSYMARADEPRLAQALRGHLAAKSGMRGVPDPGPQEVKDLAAFLRSVAISSADGPEEPRFEEPQGPAGPRRP